MSHPPTPDSRAVATVAVVGDGRLGRVLARALAAAGIAVSGPLGRGETVPAADAVILCVPDDAVRAVAAALPAGVGPVGHVAGALPLATAGVDFGLHPLQTFVGDEPPEVFQGVSFAVAGRSPAAAAIAEELAVRLGGRPFTLHDADRAAYHAAASIASNFLVTLMSAAEEVAALTGMSEEEARARLAPLVRTTVENWAHRGPADALTGPIARGDTDTVTRQRTAIAEHAPELLALFDALRDRTARLAARERAPR